MPDQTSLDSQYEQSEIERRLQDLETKISQYENGGFDIFRQFGYLQLGLDLPRLDKFGMQIQGRGTQRNALYFQDKMTIDPSSEARQAFLYGLKAGNTDGTSLFIGIKSLDADGDSAAVSVNNSTDEHPLVVLQSTLNGTRTTQVQISAFLDQIGIGGILQLDDKGTDPSTFAGAPTGGYLWWDDTTSHFRVRIGSANYNLISTADSTGSTWIAFPI